MPAPIDLHEVAERELSERYRFPWRVKACMSTACLSAGAAPAFHAMEESIEREDLALEARLIPTGCMGLCSRGPLVRVLRRGVEETMYQAGNAEVGIDIITDHIRDHKPVETNLLDHAIPFFSSQERVVLENSVVSK